MVGAMFFWRYRDDFFDWIQDESSMFRRSFSRHVIIGPFYGPRGESRFRIVSTHVLRSPSRAPSYPILLAGALFFIGLLLFLLDFFI